MSGCQLLSVSCLPSELLSTDGLDQDIDNYDTSVQPRCTNWFAEDVSPPPPPQSPSPPLHAKVQYITVTLLYGLQSSLHFTVSKQYLGLVCKAIA